MIFSKKYKVHWQKFQKYDYYIFQLKWSLCQRTERWEVGEWAPVGDAVCAAESRDWPVPEDPFFTPDWETVKWSPGGSAALWGCRSTSRGPQQRGTQWTLPHLTPLWLNHRLTGLAVQRVSETTDTAKSRASKESKDNNFWSNSDNHVDIVQRRGKNQEWSFFPPKVQWYSSVLFPFSLLPEEQRQTRFHGIDTVHKRAVLFLCCFHRFCCSFLIYWIAVEAICSS